MKKEILKTSKKMLAMLMAVCLICTAMVVAVPTQASALTGALAAIPTEKLIEYGCRGVSIVGGKLAEMSAGDDLDVVVDTFTKNVVKNGTQNTAEEIRQMCQDILDELAVMEEKISTYTSEISAAIERQNADKARDAFDNKWKEDVVNKIPADVDNACKAYIKYFITTMVNNYGFPEDEESLMTLDAFWNKYYHISFYDADFSIEAVNTAYKDMEAAFAEIYDPTNGIDAKDEAFRSAYIFNEINNAIKQITNNFVYDNVSHNNRQYSVVETAATDAYYTLPFSHQQYEYVTARAKEQIMQATILQMTLNEYLSVQGEYLKENSQDNPDWNTANILTYKNNADVNSLTSYEKCKENFIKTVNNTLTESSYIFTSDIHINTYAYTGKTQNLTTKINEYMNPADVASVELEINGYVDSFDYKRTINSTEAGGHEGNYDLGNTKTQKKYINSTLKFNRVMSGGTDREIYYILDTEQFEDKEALDFLMTKFHVKRYGMYGGSDALYGDLYLPSADFINLIKDMTDGANTFSVPKDVNAELKNLIDVPYYGAVEKYNLQDYLSDYLPAKGSKDTYILTSNYANNLEDGFWSACKYASFTVGNASHSENTRTNIKTETVSFEDLEKGHNMAVILTNNGDTYYQNATATVNSALGGAGDIKVAFDGNTLEAGQTGKIKSGEDISVRFTVDDINNFESLKLVRHNAETTETVLVNGAAELKNLAQGEDGYYSFDMKMPYSECSFVLETKETLEQDENGNFLVNDFDDLCKVANLVNNGTEKYTTATYVLANDIDCTGEDFTKRQMIGTDKVQFNGTFDGQGHTISNLNSGADVEGNDAGKLQGLFAVLGENATVKNLKVTGAAVWSDDSIAKGSAVIAKQNNGTIDNCTVKNCTVQLGDSDYLGGITGLNNGIVKNCKVEKTTLVRRWGGCGKRAMGIVCEVNNGPIENCYSMGCTFKNGTITDNCALFATDTYFS